MPVQLPVATNLAALARAPPCQAATGLRPSHACELRKGSTSAPSLKAVPLKDMDSFSLTPSAVHAGAGKFSGASEASGLPGLNAKMNSLSSPLQAGRQAGAQRPSLSTHSPPCLCMHVLV